jgi:parallel beta-helix repeat protein
MRAGSVMGVFLGGWVVAIAGCGGSSQPADGCTTRVQPGASNDATQAALQTALSGARQNNVICFGAGTYHLTDELTLTQSNVELRGPSTGEAVLDFATQVRGANGISLSGNNTKLSKLTVKNTRGDGIRATGVNGVTFSEVKVTWDAGPQTSNGGYGLYPVESQRILIERCSDAGIYVGQSSRIIVRYNEVFGNVAGIEIENSTDAEVHDNNVHDNTGGILVFNLPNLPVRDGKRAKVHHNTVRNNNQANFAPPGNTVHNVPAGTGLMVLASDANELHNNTVEGNQTMGLGIVSYFTLQLLSGTTQNDDTYDAYPESNYIHDNRFASNGSAPAEGARVLVNALGLERLEDMIWDGFVDSNKTGDVRNCFQANGSATFRNLDGGGAFENMSTDIGGYVCPGTTLSPLTL